MAIGYGDMIAIAKKIHVAVGVMNKKLFKYGCGKTITFRTNWDKNTFSLMNDVDQIRRKALCSKVNNVKRAYELQTSEHVIIAHMQSVITLHAKLQNLVKFFDKVETFCKTLAFTDKVDFIQNLLAL